MAEVYSVRADDEIDAALAALGATKGNRSKIIKEAILHLAQERTRGTVTDPYDHFVELLDQFEKAFREYELRQAEAGRRDN